MDTARTPEGPGVRTCESPLCVSRGLNSHVERQNAVSELKTGQFPEIPVGIHWYRGSCPDYHLKGLVDMMRLWFGKHYQQRKWGRWFYGKSIAFTHGVTIHHEGHAPTNQGRITLDVPGEAFDTMTGWEMVVFIHDLGRFEIQESRCDFFFDDYDRHITPILLYDTIFELGDDGVPVRHNWSGFRRIRPSFQYSDKAVLQSMLCFGSRGNVGSGKYLRIYDKNIESKGANKAIRWELETADDRAKQAARLLRGCGHDVRKFAACIGAIVGGSIDFLKRDEKPNEKNLGRLDRYGWWSAILLKLGRATLRREQVVKTVDRAAHWVEKQVIPTLQMLDCAVGTPQLIRWVVDLCHGPDRLSDQHRKALEDYLESGALGTDCITIHHQEKQYKAVMRIDTLRTAFDQLGVTLEQPG